MLGVPPGERGGETLNLKTPLGDEVLDLRAGDRVSLSGTIYTARDEAHLRMMEEGIPFDPEGAAVYHCGPVVQDGRLLAAGPTTSARMNSLSGFLIDAGVRALIGKGGMGQEVAERLRGRGVLRRLLDDRPCLRTQRRGLLDRLVERAPDPADAERREQPGQHTDDRECRTCAQRALPQFVVRES